AGRAGRPAPARGPGRAAGLLPGHGLLPGVHVHRGVAPAVRPRVRPDGGGAGVPAVPGRVRRGQPGLPAGGRAPGHSPAGGRAAGAGHAAGFSPLVARVMARVDPARSATLSGLVSTGSLLAGVVAIATVGSVYFVAGGTGAAASARGWQRPCSS